MKIKLEDLPPHCQAQVQAILEAEKPKPVEPVHIQRHTKSEKELQELCEKWLSLHGYLRMTADNAESGIQCKGWFGHLVVTERNPFMPDLFIFGIDEKPPLLIEFKMRDQYQPGQKAMIERGFWHECRTFEAFIAKVIAWEKRWMG